MLEWMVTSRARMVTLGRLARLGILDGVRAVAKTCKPRSWKTSARAPPMPPSLQPVMRIDLGAMGVGWGLGVWDLLRKIVCSKESRPRCDGQGNPDKSQGAELGLFFSWLGIIASVDLLSGCSSGDRDCRICSWEPEQYILLIQRRRAGESDRI